MEIRIINFIEKWNYRLHNLFDVYYKGENITTQSHLHVYTSFWDRMEKQSRHYTYITFYIITRLVNKYK